MSNGKKLFVVRGSEDGNLGVYSNMKRAHEKALAYLNQNGPVETLVTFLNPCPPNQAFPDGFTERAASYVNVCKKLSDIGHCEIEVKGDRVTAQIEEFYLNQI